MSLITSYAQDRWNEIADTILRYGPFQTYLFETDTRRWLVESEEAEGYEKCYRRFYDAVCQMAEKALQKGDDEAVCEMNIARLYMSWQQDSIDTDTALRQMNQIIDTNRQEHGDTTNQHVRYACYLAHFLCAAQRYDEAEQWCLHIDTLIYRDAKVYDWNISTIYQVLMAAQVGQGHMADAWEMARTIARHYSYHFPPSEEEYILEQMELSKDMLAKARRLAPQLLMPLLPPSPATFTQNDISPWPLDVTVDITSQRQLHLFAIFNLFDLFMRIDMPLSYMHKVNDKVEEMNYHLCDYTNWDSIAPPLSAELCRRTAIMASIEAAQCDTIHYPHNEEVNTVMSRWHRCMAQEQLNFGRRSSVALLCFCTEWIKKGYPLSMLPLVEEAASTMQRELTDPKPTQRMLLLRRAAHHWLQTELPQFTDLVSTIPDYATVMVAFETLKEELGVR